MKIQKTNKTTTSTCGKLYLVATPIGNLQDMSIRAKEILSTVDLIAAEDTRHTRKLLSHLDISTPMVSYHEHNEKKQSASLISQLTGGKTVALVSDAGLPAISDPGEEIVKEAIEADIPVIPIPGANAALTALIASGLPTHPFLFLGFLPRTKSKRVKELEKWVQFPATIIFYEAPHRLLALLSDLMEVWDDPKVAIVRELTKKHEEWYRGSCSECMQWVQEYGVRGEYTVLVEGEKGHQVDVWWKALTIEEHVNRYLEQGEPKKEALRNTARDRNLSKREVYQVYHQLS